MSDGKTVNDWINDWAALQRQSLAAWSDFMQRAQPGAAAPSPTPSPAFDPASFMPPGFNPAAFGAAGFNPAAFNPAAFNPAAFNPAMFGGAGFNPAAFMSPGASMPGFGAAFGMPGFAGATPSPGGWHEGFEQWARMFAQPGKHTETVERVMESGKAYVDMIRAMVGAPGASAEAMAGGQAWMDALRAGLPKEFGMPGFDAGVHPFFRAVRDIAGRGAQGLAELPNAFAPFLDYLRHEQSAWLRLPAFGLAREHQEHYQRTAVAFLEYQEALRNYNAMMLKASQRGLDLLEGKLAERAEPGRAIDTPRALYDLWVDAAEEAYGEIALTDEFAKAYGELANAQMRMRAQIQAEVERIGTDLGMPTRSELDSVHRRLHDLRRDVRNERGGGAGFAELEARIDALRDDVAQLKAQSGARAAPAPAAAKPATSPVAAAVAKTSPAKKSAASKPAVKKPAPAKAAAKAPAAGKAGTKSAVARKTPGAAPAAPAPPPATSAAAMPAAVAKAAKSTRAPAARSKRPAKRVVAKAKPAKAVAAPEPQPAIAPGGGFGDAIAAMRRRVAKRGPRKIAAARAHVATRTQRLDAEPSIASRSRGAGLRVTQSKATP